MSVVSTVLEKLRGKRQEQIKSIWQQYHELVKELAGERQVDVDELAICMDQLDKSDADLEADIENQRNRVSYAAQHAKFCTIKSSIPTLERDQEKAQAAYDAAIAKYNPPLREAAQKVRDAQNQILTLSGFSSRLIETCRDPQLLDQRREIDEQRKAINIELRDMDNTPVKNLNELQARLQKLMDQKSKMSKENSPTYWRECVSNIEHVEKNIEAFRVRVAEFNKRQADLKNQLADLDRQSAAVLDKMLLP